MSKLDWKLVTRQSLHDGSRYMSSLDTERIRTASLENLLITVFFEGDFSKLVVRSEATEKRGYFHSHTHYELLHIAAGQMDMYFEDRCLHLAAGSLIVIPPGVFHKSHTASDELIYQNGQFYYSEQPKPICADLYGHFHAVFGGTEVLQITSSDTMRNMLYSLSATGRRRNAVENMRFAAEFQLLLLALCDELSPLPADFYAERVMVESNEMNIRYEISTYLNHCYKRNPSMAELAAGLHISERQLDRRIREMYGQSFTERVTEMRMRSAKHELLCTGYGISEIASHVGYPSVKNFFAAFKKYYNQTPEQFRKQSEKQFPTEA